MVKHRIFKKFLWDRTDIAQLQRSTPEEKQVA